MDSREFYDGLKTDQEQDAEWTASAEHFVRLKKQVGLGSESAPEEPVEKVALLGGLASGGKKAGGLFTNLAKGMTSSIGSSTSPSGGIFSNIGSNAGTPKLAAGPVRRALEKLSLDKKAGILDAAKTLKDPAAWIPAAAGAALLGGVTYSGSKPREELGGKSRDETALGSAVASQKKNPSKSFSGKLKDRFTESSHGYAQVLREHPVKATILGSTVGAVTGASIARLLGAGR